MKNSHLATKRIFTNRLRHMYLLALSVTLALVPFDNASAQSEFEALAKQFAPVLRFDREAQGYPMSAQVYFDEMLCGENGGPTSVCDPNDADSPCDPQTLEGAKKIFDACATQSIPYSPTTFQDLLDQKVPTYYSATSCPTTGQVRIRYWFYYGHQPACGGVGTEVDIPTPYGDIPIDFLDIVDEQGEHIADWEHIDVILSIDQTQVAAVKFAQHTGSYTRIASSGEAYFGRGSFDGRGFEIDASGRPIVYVGRSAHGSYHDSHESQISACLYFDDNRRPTAETSWNTGDSPLIDLTESSESWIQADSIATFEATIDATQSNAGAGTGSTATGFATMTFDDVTNLFSWKITWTALSTPETVAHFHGPDGAGVNAGVQVPIPDLVSPSIGSATITDLQAEKLLDGKWYINIHSEAFPGGEIRGQVLHSGYTTWDWGYHKDVNKDVNGFSYSGSVGTHPTQPDKLASCNVKMCDGIGAVQESIEGFPTEIPLFQQWKDSGCWASNCPTGMCGGEGPAVYDPQVSARLCTPNFPFIGRQCFDVASFISDALEFIFVEVLGFAVNLLVEKLPFLADLILGVEGAVQEIIIFSRPDVFCASPDVFSEGLDIGIASGRLTAVSCTADASFKDAFIIPVGDTGLLEPGQPNSPPVADAGADYALECTSAAGTFAGLDGSLSYDPNNDPLTYSWTGAFPEGGGILSEADPLVTLPLGENELTLTVSDGEFSATDTVVVAIWDTTQPDIDALVANPTSLSPPNHKMREVTITPTVTDICDLAPVCTISGITSNEADNGNGTGNTAIDSEITGPLTALLRAERSGTGSGRIYELTVQCMDASSNVSTATVDVAVEHDNGKR